MEIIIIVGLLSFIVIFIAQIVSKLKYKEISEELKIKLDYSEKALIEKDILLDQKEALFLKSSINPHLFNNALNIITSKTESAIKAAQEVIDTSEGTLESIEILTNVLRYIIYESKEEFVPLNDEVKFIEEYLKLQKIRIPDHFTVSINTEALSSYNASDKLYIAPLICIDFIENAFKYTNVQSSEGFINIKFELIDKDLIFSVRNTKNKELKKSESGGFGYDNLKKRLNLLYKSKYDLDIDNDENIFSANLKIKLHEK